MALSWQCTGVVVCALQAKPGTQQVKKAQAPIRKNFPAPKGTRSTQKYGKGEQQDQLWLPNTERPQWLDGSMPGSAPIILSHFLMQLGCSAVNTTRNNGYSWPAHLWRA